MAVRAHSDRFGSSPLRGAKSVKLPSLGELSELVGALYDAALDPARWPAALERLAAAFEAAQATLSFDPSGREETAETFGAGGEVLKAKGVGSGLLAAVWRLGDGVLVLWRRDHAGRKKSDLQRIALLGPHLRRAVQAARRFAELGLERAKALDALDRLPRGVLLLQAKGQVGFVNAAAREILARADGLVI
ncbi:MAG TPA: hypothetical protein VFA23_05525, partial [Dongiaceae bacterium]|nr:hypothetical protein [Dongiaceae bacterium]